MKPTTSPLTIKPAPLGSISHATLRTPDLLQTFTEQLEWEQNRNGAFLSSPENFSLRNAIAAAIGEAQDCWNGEGDEIADDKEDEASELVNETLPDLLENFSPPYCYFGTHCGDGSDFGYWPSWESIEDLPCVEDSDEAIALGEDCRFVNDHGNTTVFNGLGVAILEIV